MHLSSKDLEAELTGKTLKVYMLLLKSKNPMSIRSIQKKLGFSSPSVVYHHLEKLSDMGLVRKTESGEYVVSEIVKVGILKEFIKLGRALLPKYIFYSVFMSTMLAFYIIFYTHDLSIHNIVALLFGSIATAILWLETFKRWMELRHA